jgi:hypothetical protein
MQEAGKFLIISGIFAVIVGIVLYAGWGQQAFGWLFRLPGDIRIERDNFRFYLPITTSIVLSIIITVIIRLIMLFKGN